MSYILELLNKSGTKVAQLTESECSVNIRRTINGEWACTINYPIPSPDQGENKSQYFELWKVRARIVDTHNLSDATTFILQRPEYSSSAGRVELVVTGEHYCIDKMRSEVVNSHIDFKSIPTNSALEKIFSFSSLSIDVQNVTIPVTVKISWETVLSAFQKIMSICKAEYDFDESTNTIIVKKSLGTSDKYIVVRPGRNLNSLKLVKYNQNVINFMYGVGGGEPPCTVAGARHIVAAKNGQVITLNSNKVVPENGSWDEYQIKHSSGYYDITSSTHGATSDTLALSGDLSSISVGDYVTICYLTIPVNYIRATTSIASRDTIKNVYKNTKYDDTVNLIRNGDFSEVMDFWSLVGSAVPVSALSLEQTTYISYGTDSVRVTTTEISTGIQQQVSTESGKYYSILVNIYLVSGSACLVISIGGTDHKINVISSTGWQKLSAKIKVSSTSLTLKILSNTASSQFYVDAVCIAETKFVNNTLQDKPFVLNCGQIDLWYETFDSLMSKKDPLIEYVANFADLHRISPEDFPFDRIEIGDSVLITDESLGVSNLSARITELNYDPFNPHLTEHTITSGGES